MATILLTGAPNAASLSWNEEDLTASLLPCFAEDDTASTDGPGPFLSESFDAPVWRVLSLEPTHLETGLTPNSRAEALLPWQPVKDRAEAAFLHTQCTSFLSKAPQSEPSQATNVSNFLEQSFAAYEEAPSSQVIGLGASGSQSSTSLSKVEESFASIDPSQNDSSCILPVAPDLLPLSSIPTASRLNALYPQTVTVDLIVGLIAVPPPRTIQPRRGGSPLELLELTAGDETRAGFGLNLWLPPGESALRTMAERLRPRDVILFRRIALKAWNGEVYGQSLRRDMTKVDLLWRQGKVDLLRAGHSDRAEETGAVLAKAKKVREWVLMFVGA